MVHSPNPDTTYFCMVLHFKVVVYISAYIISSMLPVGQQSLKYLLCDSLLKKLDAFCCGLRNAGTRHLCREGHTAYTQSVGSKEPPAGGTSKADLSCREPKENVANATQYTWGSLLQVATWGAAKGHFKSMRDTGHHLLWRYLKAAWASLGWVALRFSLCAVLPPPTPFTGIDPCKHLIPSTFPQHLLLMTQPLASYNF